MVEQSWEWQKEFLTKVWSYFIAGKKDYLVYAGVGAGKTRAALEFASRVLRNRIKRIIVITFTGHLVRQWGIGASGFGLNLLELSGNGKLEGGLASDSQGYICTYNAMGRFPDLHESFATTVPTLVIFDEIHHLGDDLEDCPAWGEAAKSAFGRVDFRLALSGTPFRSNNQRIPFVNYKPVEGNEKISEVIPDTKYPYGEAVTDLICRRVQFEGVDGEIKWHRDDMPDIRHNYKFADNLAEPLFSDRLRFAIELETLPEQKNEILPDMIRKANQKLKEIRMAGHSDAGGLIIADGITHARLIASMLQTEIKQKPVVVTNDEPRAQEYIAAFDKGVSPWIVAVKMVTEGVDIRRLRVCVYASRVTEELFVTQVIGRIVRKPKEHRHGESYFFYPKDPRLVAIIEKIEEELRLYYEEANKNRNGGACQKKRVEKTFDGNKPVDWDAIIAGSSYSMEEIALVDSLRREFETMKDTSLHDLLKFAKKVYQKRMEDETDGQKPEKSYTERRTELRSLIQSGVGVLESITREPYNEIHTKLNRQTGAQDKDTASIAQLEMMLRLINEWIAIARRGSYV